MFQGIRIVELAQYVFVPAATAFLADWGAEVIKVEAPGGDPYRTIRIGDGREIGAANLAMEQNNRGKLSLGLDLKSPAGLEALLRVLDGADVFATSLRPAALVRLGLDPETLRARWPRLIYARGNGTGFGGADADKAGYDAASFWARGGFADVLRSAPAQPPVRTRPAAGDHASSTAFALGLVSALFRRERTGQGGLVETSLLANAAWILSADLGVACAGIGVASAEGIRMKPLPLQRAYRTADGRWLQIMILAPDRHWASFCALIGMPDGLTDPRFSTMDGRIAFGQELVERIGERIGSRSWAEWRPLFEAWEGSWELVATIEEVSRDPEVRANDMLFDVALDDGTPLTLVSAPVVLDGRASPGRPARAPDLGQHSAAVLAKAGLSEAEIAALHEAGAAF